MILRVSNQSKLVIVSICIIYAVSWLIPSCFADTSVYHPIFRFYIADGEQAHQLYLSIPQSLYDYYYGKKHAEVDLIDFITPGVFYSFANELWKVCHDTTYADETFVNAVLMIVHQLSYKPSAATYPVETLVEKSGDCDTLSFLSASILLAGGFDVVLLSYDNFQHMNIGVHLAQPPSQLTTEPIYHDYQGQRYYIAECTSQGTDVLSDWRVGESPQRFLQDEVEVISVDDWKFTAPGTISSSLDVSPTGSTITIDLSPTKVKIQESVIIKGSISSASPIKQIVIYTSTTGYEWNTLTTVTADSNGAYSYEWTPILHGICHVRASYLGDHQIAAADSAIITLRIASELNMNTILVIGYSLIAVLMMMAGLIISEVIQTARVFL